MSSKNKCSHASRGLTIAIGAACLFTIPVQSVLATSAIAQRVEAFCAPSPTMPDVTSCSACHSTTNNRGLSDLTAAGVWALNGQDSNFCPGAATPPPAPAPAPGPTPPGTGMGMGSGTGSGGSMGRGVGGSSDEDDDDDEKKPEDD